MSSEINKALHPSTSFATAAAEMEEPLLPSISSTSFAAAAVEIEDPLLPSTSFAIATAEMEELLFPSTSAAAAAAEMEEPLLPSTSSAGDEIEEVSLNIRNLPSSSSSGSILKNSMLILFIFFVYLTFGVSFYYINPQGFFGVETNSIINGLYFCIVTFCTAWLWRHHPHRPPLLRHSIASLSSSALALSTLWSPTQSTIFSISSSPLPVQWPVP